MAGEGGRDAAALSSSPSSSPSYSYAFPLLFRPPPTNNQEEEPPQPNNKEKTNNHKKKNDDDKKKQLLLGHKLLHNILNKESQLKHLQFLRNVTTGTAFRSTDDHHDGIEKSDISSITKLQRLFTTLHQTSQQRKTELEHLWANPKAPSTDDTRDTDADDDMILPDPRIHASPTPMGDSIQSLAEWAGKVELVWTPVASSWRGTGGNTVGTTADDEWQARFCLLQAQATRMVASIASATAKFEISPHRVAWLQNVSTEYEALREDIVAILLLRFQQL